MWGPPPDLMYPSLRAVLATMQKTVKANKHAWVFCKGSRHLLGGQNYVLFFCSMDNLYMILYNYIYIYMCVCVQSDRCREWGLNSKRIFIKNQRAEFHRRSVRDIASKRGIIRPVGERQFNRFIFAKDGIFETMHNCTPVFFVA